ncbi:unnamed protein product [Urochloa decumbens]|uniref:Uncharacterized protein n=1 Tax=Urochloa decumbens TaxID=240449 RepID=A0ABC8VYF6_9POAL
MQDATGQTLSLFDLVMFQTAGAAHLDRGLAVRTLPGNKLIAVQRVDGTEVAMKPCDLTVVDRFCMFPGTTVALVSDPGGQAGVITGVNKALDLVDECGGVVATGVSPAEVRPVRELTLGDYVVSGTWLGRVVEVSVDVDVFFADGSVCRVTKAGDKLRVVAGRFRGTHDKKNAFFPGDRVAGDTSVFKASRWLEGHWKPSRGEGTVAKPNPCNLTFFSAGDAILRWFWAVSDRCFFRREPCRASGAKKKNYRVWIKQRRRRVGRGLTKLPRVKWPMTIADTRTTVDVLWQDGTRQRGVPSASLFRTAVRNEQDLFPGQRVVGKALSLPNDADAGGGRVGVVKSLSYKDQTACVSWNTTGDDSSEVVMSTYDLARSSDHRFFYGSMVLRLQATVEETVAPERKSNNATTNDLSWVGHIVDLCDAQYIHVKWGDGTTSKVLLHEIAIVKPRSIDHMLREMGDWVNDQDDGDHRQPSADKAQEDTIHGGSTSDAEGGGPVEGKAIIGKVCNIIKAGIRTLSGMLLAQGNTMYMLSRSMAFASRPERPAITVKFQSSLPAASGDQVFQFKHFDVVQCPQDHHYLDNKEQGFGDGGRKRLKRVQKEWKVLETSLPEYIITYMCLSLLNTFGGKGAELWSPEMSSVLQVVISIQGLVLTAQPYYNETGYEAQVGKPEGQRNEMPYSENTYLVNLNTMLHLIRRPLMGFEGFIRDHFHRRGQHILRACEAYQQEGCPVGTLDGEAVATEASKDRSCSVGFRLALAKVMPRLVEAFSGIGAQV